MQPSIKPIIGSNVSGLQSSTYMYWGRAILKLNGQLITAQGPMTCKDYVIDTFYRNELVNAGPDFYREIYIEDERESPYFWFNLTGNLTEYLNIFKTWCKTIGLQEIEIIQDTKYSNFYFVKYDPILRTCDTLLSIFLSQFRYTMRTGLSPDSLITQPTKDNFKCNEQSYYSHILGYNKTLKDFFDQIWLNPLSILKYWDDKKYRQDGYLLTNKHDMGHGSSGLFFIINHISYYLPGGYYAKDTSKITEFRDGFVGNHILVTMYYQQQEEIQQALLKKLKEEKMLAEAAAKKASPCEESSNKKEEGNNKCHGARRATDD
jgi:hypothetical protein